MDPRAVILLGLLLLAGGCGTHSPDSRGRWWGLSVCDSATSPGYCEARARAKNWEPL